MDICIIIRELLAVRANQNLASIGLKSYRKGNSKLVSSLLSTLVPSRTYTNTFYTGDRSGIRTIDSGSFLA